MTSVNAPQVFGDIVTEPTVNSDSPAAPPSELINANAWQSDPKEGEVINNLEYAEPVIYGTNLPPSWRGKYRTRQNTVPGFPDLIAKELESWAQREYNKIANR